MELNARPMTELRSDYWMIQKLGVGGFAKVYLIKHRETKRHFACKHQKWLTPDTQRNARREAGILKRLAQPGRNRHVVNFEDYFEGEEQSVILTEYLEGGELFQRIASKDYSLTEAKCRDFFRQIVRGVAYLHENKILHLDIKPQNVVLVAPPGGPNGSSNDNMSISSEDGLSQSQRSLAAPPCDRLKLIDFGLAKELGLYADRIPITMCGTLEFMSPEVMKCSHASPASDMWSVGVVLYMMLSGGVSPFWAGSEYRTQRKIVRGIYDLEHPNFKQVSKAALDCVQRLLDVDGPRRMSAEKCLEHSWLTGSYLDTLKELETTWMRKYLAKRRWQRWFNAVRAMNRMKHLGAESSRSSSHQEAAAAAAAGAEEIGLKPMVQKERWV